MTEAETTMKADPAVATTEEHAHPPYMLIWLWLFILTILEVGVAMLGALPKGVVVGLLLVMAIWKAALVALYYMHLKFEPTRLRWIALSPILPAIIMVVIILMEYV